jgi:threonyl-tRNA synthetase
LNNRSDKIGAKIRQAELEKINVMLIIGEKEVEEQKISVRRRFEGNTGTIGIDELKLDLINEIKTRSLSHRKETATTT